MECYFIQGFHINNRTYTKLFYTHDLDQAVKFFNDYIFDDKDDIKSINLCAACCDYPCDNGDGFCISCEVTELYDVKDANCICNNEKRRGLIDSIRFGY